MTVNLEKLSVKQLYKRIADLTHERDEIQRKHDDLVITSATVISELQGKVEALGVERDLVAADNSYLRGQIICWAKECDRIIYIHTNKVTDAHQLEAEKELSSTLRKADAALEGIRVQAKADGVELALKTLEESRFGDAGDLALLSKLLVKLRKESGQ